MTLRRGSIRARKLFLSNFAVYAVRISIARAGERSKVTLQPMQYESA